MGLNLSHVNTQTPLLKALINIKFFSTTFILNYYFQQITRMCSFWLIFYPGRFKPPLQEIFQRHIILVIFQIHPGKLIADAVK